jgi:hypothetical protein
MARQLYLQTVNLLTFGSKNNIDLLIRSQVRGLSDVTCQYSCCISFDTWSVLNSKDRRITQGCLVHELNPVLI